MVDGYESYLILALALIGPAVVVFLLIWAYYLFKRKDVFKDKKKKRRRRS